jgi:hypothetical protein
MIFFFKLLIDFISAKVGEGQKGNYTLNKGGDISANILLLSPLLKKYPRQPALGI